MRWLRLLAARAAVPVSGPLVDEDTHSNYINTAQRRSVLLSSSESKSRQVSTSRHAMDEPQRGAKLALVAQGPLPRLCLICLFTYAEHCRIHS